MPGRLPNRIPPQGERRVNANPELLIERRGQALWLTTQCEDCRSTINVAVLEALTTAPVDAGRDAAVWTVVPTGTGMRAFCVGADPQTGQSFRFDYSQPYQALADLFHQTCRCTAPPIARVSGVCIASGMGLLVMRDLAVASHSVTFGLPEVKVGVFPIQVPAVSQHRLPRYVLNELCLTGGLVSIDHVLAVGLVNEVAEPEALDGAVDALLARPVGKSPSVIRCGLYTFKHMESLSFEQAVVFTESQIGLPALTEDTQEG